MKKGFLKTAEFAKYCNVSKQTLIHYDKKGIFQPHHVDENDYRYYAMSQYEYFIVIAMLRQLGTPLKEIKSYIENRSAQGFLEFLDNKQSEIDQKIRELQSMKQLIHSRKRLTMKGVSKVNSEEIAIRYMNEEKLIISSYFNDFDEIHFLEAVSELEQYLGGMKSADAGAMIEKEALIQEDYDGISYFYIRFDKEGSRTFIKPEGLYAIGYHTGTFETTKQSYRRIIDYINSHGYRIVGNSYEDSLLDSCTQNSEEEYLTQISIQVDKV